MIALKVNGREVYTGERVPSDAPIVLVVGNSDLRSQEENELFGGLWGDSIDNDTEEVEDGYEEEL